MWERALQSDSLLQDLVFLAKRLLQKQGRPPRVD